MRNHSAPQRASRGAPTPALLSEKEEIILELLTRGGEAYGLQLVAASEGRLKRGTVYVTLLRMEQKGYLASRISERGPGEAGMPRPLYRASAHGARMLEACRQWHALMVQARGALP